MLIIFICTAAAEAPIELAAEEIEVVPINPSGETFLTGDVLPLNVSTLDAGEVGMDSVTVDVSAVNETVGTVVLTYSGGYWVNNSIIVDTFNTGTLSLPITAIDNAGNVNTNKTLTVYKPTFVHYVPAEFPSIQAAVDAANNSDAIIVNSGTYEEMVVVDKPGIILQGVDTGSGRPVIIGTYTLNVYDSAVSYDEISPNFNLYGEGFTGAINLFASGCTVEGFNVTGSDAGIYVISSNNTISDNTAYQNFLGFFVNSEELMQGSLYEPILASNNTLADNKATNNLCGFCLFASENTFVCNTANGNNYGIICEGSGNWIYQNVICDNDCNVLSSGYGNQWNSSEFGNYYDDVYSPYVLTETGFEWINTTQEDADWSDTDDDNFSEKMPIGFDFTLDGVTYTHIQVVSNGIIQLVPEGGFELNDSEYEGKEYWVDSYPDETFIFALCDDLCPNFEGEWYGYTRYSAGDNDSEGNEIPVNLTVIDYHMSTYDDYYDSNSTNYYQVVLYENGALRFNFKDINYLYTDADVYSGLYLGNDSSVHAKETIHVAKDGEYDREEAFSYTTPIIRVLSSTYDANGDGIAEAPYRIGGSEMVGLTGASKVAGHMGLVGSEVPEDYDYLPLVLASKAVSPPTVSGSDTIFFTVSTDIIDHADVGVEKVELYCKKDDGDWSKYGESGTGTFTFSTSEAGDYYFYTAATDVYGNVEGLPDDYDSHTAVSINSESSRSNSDGPSHYQPQPSEWEEKGITFREPADSANVKFDKEPVYAIAVDSKNPFSNARFRTKNHAGQPSGVPQPEGTVYKYTDIEFVSGDCDIEGASIFFKVDKAWLEENGLDSEDVKLLRYHDGEWMELETTVEDEDADYFYFSALTPGFSTFAIIAEGGSGVVDIEPSVTGEVPAEETASEVDKPEESGEKSPGFSIFAGVLGLVVCFYMRRD